MYIFLGTLHFLVCYLLIINNFFADKNVMVFMIIIIFIVKSGF